MSLFSLGLYSMVNILGVATGDGSNLAPPEPREVVSDPLTPMGTGWGLGISGGITSGFGVSVRRHFENRLGFQVAALYLPLGDGNHWMSFGAQGFYTILRGRRTRFYGLTGAHLMIDGSIPTEERQRERARLYTTPITATWSRSLFLGLGLGLELHFTRWIGWALEVPLSLLIDLETPSPLETWRDKVRPFPAANMSLTFYFR